MKLTVSAALEQNVDREYPVVLPVPLHRKLKAYYESELHTFSHKEKLKSVIPGFRHIRFADDRVFFKYNSGRGLDTEFLSNFNISTSLLLNRWKCQVKKILGTPPSVERYLRHFGSLWDNNPEAVSTADIIKLHRVIHFERILAYNYFNKVSPYLKRFSTGQETLLTIGEVGPGAGNLPFVIARFLQSRPFRYVIIDLPEALPFSIAHLMFQCPQLEFILPHEFSVDKWRAHAAKNSFFFLTPDQIHLLPDDSLDVGINTNSFSEMQPPAIQEYFRFFRRTLKGENVFFTVNRIEKAMDLNAEISINLFEASRRYYAGDKSVYINRFHEFPWSDKDKVYEYYVSRFNTIRTGHNFKVKIVRMSKVP